MASKKSRQLRVGYYHNGGENAGLFKIPCSTEIDFSTRNAKIYFDVSKLTKNGVPYPLSVSEKYLADNGYELRVEDILIKFVKTRRATEDILVSIARGKGKGIVRRLLSDGRIK